MFTEIQIMEIEDKVINKLVYPLVILNRAQRGGYITHTEIERSIKNLSDLFEWVRSLRK